MHREVVGNCNRNFTTTLDGSHITNCFFQQRLFFFFFLVRHLKTFTVTAIWHFGRAVVASAYGCHLTAVARMAVEWHISTSVSNRAKHNFYYNLYLKKKKQCICLICLNIYRDQWFINSLIFLLRFLLGVAMGTGWECEPRLLYC